MSETTTIREIHERCKARHEPWTGSAQKVGGQAMCVGCDLPWPCPDYNDAVTAVATLDNAARYLRSSLGKGGAKDNAIICALALLVGPNPPDEGWTPSVGVAAGNCPTCGAPNSGGYVTPGCPECVWNRAVPDPVRLVGRVEPHDDNGDTT